jgi:UDP-glucose 6-dehydrogenase
MRINVIGYGSVGRTQEFLLKTFLCVFITFRNKADYLIKKLELNSNEVARLVYADARMAKCGTSRFGQPNRGKLVPNCVHGLINAFCREGVKSIVV